MKKQSTSRGFAVLSAAGMFVKILSVLYIPILLSIIGKNGHANYSAAYQIYVFVFVITNSGIPVAISKIVSEFSAVGNFKDAVKSFKIARLMLLILGTVMTVIMMSFSKPVSNALGFKNAHLAVFALAPSILFTSVSSAYRGYFQGRGNMTPTAVSQVIEQVLNTIFTLVFAALLIKYGMVYGAAGGTIGTTLGALASAIYLILIFEKKRRFKVPSGVNTEQIKRYTNKQLIGKILYYGMPITICVGMTYAGNLIDVSNVMSRLARAGITSDYAEILYGGLIKYQQLLNVPIAIISALSASILPAIAASAALKDKAGVREKINYAFRMCFLIALPSAVGLAVLSEPTFKLIFGAKYLEGADLMLYGSLVLVLTAAVQIQMTILQSLGKLYASTAYSLAGIISKIIFNYILIAIPGINIKGAVFGTIIGYVVTLMLNNRMIKKRLKIRYSLINHSMKPFIASAFMGLVVYITYFDLMYLLNFISSSYFKNAISTIISVIIGMIVYLYSLVLTGGIDKKDLESMPSKLRRLIPRKIRARMR